MPTVQPVTREVLVEYLKRNEIEFQTDDEGNLALDFDDQFPEVCPVDIWLILDTEEGVLFKVFALVDVAIPEAAWDSAIGLCNAWNSESPWPTAYLLATEAGTGEASIHFERSIDLTTGIHAELLDDFISQTIGAIVAFAEWATERQFWLMINSPNSLARRPLCPSAGADLPILTSAGAFAGLGKDRK
ncbi:MAG: YbjN domain-containing protein [Chloroflexi bacterium]|nr:YbjN domain-containing protein [Chloroflexota bacterium]